MNFDVALYPAVPRAQSLFAALRGPLLVALLYYLGAEAAFLIGTLSDKIFALFWPPNVILFCALLVVPGRHWWRYIAMVLPAHTIAEIGVGMPLPQLLVAFVTNCTLALLNAYLVRRHLAGPPWLGTFRNALAYILITAGVGPMLTALGGALVPILGGGSGANYWLFWMHWYLANALPCLTLGPVFMIWFLEEGRWVRWAPSRQLIEPALLATGLVAVCVLAIWLAGQLSDSEFLPTVLLLPLVPVLWATVRYGREGASGAIFVVAVILTWQTLNGPGLPSDESAERSILVLQLFLMGLSIPLLLLGVVIDELRGAAQTTRQLASSLVRAQDEERRRIARDLHDSTGQHLIAATLIAERIHRLLPPSAEPAMHQLEDMLQQSIREVRTVSYVLHPPLLEESGLEVAIRHYIDGFVERTGVDVELFVMPDFGRLGPNVELVLFLVVQESLTNIHRHSGSKIARIRLVMECAGHRKNAVLTIEDAGKGFPRTPGLSRLVGPKHAGGFGQGVGLASMRERLHQIDGVLEIESQTGQTIVRAVVPLLDRERSLRAGE